METAARSLSEPWDVVAAAARTVRARLAELGAALDAPACFAADTTVALLRAHAICLRFAHTALPESLDLVWNWVAGHLTPSCLVRFRTLAWLQLPRHERRAELLCKETLDCSTETRTLLNAANASSAWGTSTACSTSTSSKENGAPVLATEVIRTTIPVGTSVLEAARVHFLRQHLAIFAKPFSWSLPPAAAPGELAEPAEPALELTTETSD